jgi:hypothetical protein
VKSLFEPIMIFIFTVEEVMGYSLPQWGKGDRFSGG